MYRNYFDKREQKFYYKERDKKIEYRLLLSILKNMKRYKIKESKYFFPSSNEFFLIKIIKEIDGNTFEFLINKSLTSYIYNKKKIFFQDDTGKITDEIIVYNSLQLVDYQEYLIEIKKNSNIEFFDQFDNLITQKEKIDNFAFFNKAHKLKVVNNSSEKIITQNYYKNIFDCYINNKYENNGQELSFNFEDYSEQKPDEFNFVTTTSRNEFLLNLEFFINSKEKFIAFTGLPGTGKTMTLLQFIIRLSLDFSKCYFNIKTLSKIKSTKKLASEFVKFFYRESHYEYYEQLIKLIEEKKNLLIWDVIIEILNFINNLDEIRKTIIIVIDQYKIDGEQELKLFKIIKSEKYSSKMKFIICGTLNDNNIEANIIDSSINKEFILNRLFPYKIISNLFSVEDIIKNDEIKIMMKQFNYIPKYYYLFINKYHKDEVIVQDQEKLKQKINEFLSFNFKYLECKLRSFFIENNIDIKAEYNNICQILQGNLIYRKYFQRAIQMIPLKYIIFENKEDQDIQISPAFDLIYGPLRKVYKETSVNYMFPIEKISLIKDNGELGKIFDSLVNSNFDIGKKIFGLDISHVIIVDEILTFEYIKKIINEDVDYLNREINYEKLNDQKVIYLEQYNSNGQLVDGGFLIPNKNNSYDILLYQCSFKKRKLFTKEFIYNNIFKTIKSNIKQKFGINIMKIYFMYILDKDEHSMIKDCINTNIYYIFYNYETSKFLHNDNKEINEFDDKIFDKMEIQEPNQKMIELFKLQDEINDLTPFKKIFLTKKRNLEIDENEEEEEDKELNEIKDDIEFIETKYGYRNKHAKLMEAKNIDYEQIAEEQNEQVKIVPELKDIPKNWQHIFNEYDSYQLLKENLPGYLSIFPLPVFYTYNNKYLIVKDKDSTLKSYSIYDFNTGKKLEGNNLRNALDSFEIHFFNSDKEMFDVNAYSLKKKET